MDPYALEAWSYPHVALISLLSLLHAIDTNLLQEIIAVDDNEEGDGYMVTRYWYLVHEFNNRKFADPLLIRQGDRLSGRGP